MRIFIDSSVFIRHYYGVETALTLLDTAINKNETAISQTVVEEVFFKLLYMETKRIYGKTGKYRTKKNFIRNPEKFGLVKEYIEGFLIESIEQDIIELLEVNEDILRDSVKVSFTYRLLPNDALIAATCKYYGIRKIATFDEDFDRARFLERVNVR